MEQQKSVIIDAGHGGAEPGAMFEGRKEKDDTLRLAVAVGETYGTAKKCDHRRRTRRGRAGSHV